MAEALKDSFGLEVSEFVADAMSAVLSEFDRATFLADCARNFESLSLTERARHVSNALARVLPDDRRRAMEVIVASLGPDERRDRLGGMAAFRYLPYVFFVADHGQDHFETAMWAQYELTKRFTAEFSIRTFLDNEPDRTLACLQSWIRDPNAHVRRLVSEGTRPRLPWAQRLRAFQADPEPVLVLLEQLKDDPEEYVRRSVANNLNDIARDHPDRVVALARAWWQNGDARRRRLIRHGLRTLIKQCHPGALALLGYTPAPHLNLSGGIDPASPRIGDRVTLRAELANRGRNPALVLLDFRIHFVRARGPSPKVFKGAEFELPVGTNRAVQKTVSLQQQTTRTHYPGTHEVEVLVNGVARPLGSFDLGE